MPFIILIAGIGFMFGSEGSVLVANSDRCRWTMATMVNPVYISVVVNFLIFLMNDMYGFISWKKRERENRRII